MSRYTDDYYTLKYHLGSVKSAIELAVRARKADKSGDPDKVCDDLIEKYCRIAEAAYKEFLPHQRADEMDELYRRFQEWVKANS